MSSIQTLRMAIAEILTAIHRDPGNTGPSVAQLEKVFEIVDTALADPLWTDKVPSTVSFGYALDVLTHCLTDPAFGLTRNRTEQLMARARHALAALKTAERPESPIQWTVLPGSPKENGLI